VITITFKGLMVHLLPMDNINFPEVRYPSDIRLFLFRYILPGLLFMAISIFYIFAFIKDPADKLIGIGSAMGWIIALVVTIGLFGIGLLLRLFPLESYAIFPLYSRLSGKENPFNRLHRYIEGKSDAILEAFQIAIPYNVKKDKERYLWLFILHDKMESKAVLFMESAYMFWFNFALTALIFLILIPITYFFLPSYWVWTSLSRLFIVLMLILSILSIIRGFETFYNYLSEAMIFLETKIHIKQTKW
jgi:hypothetical protein